MRNVLFITWDGPQTTYLESLFLPIFNRLAENGPRFHVLQFTWGDSERVDRTRRACAAVGVSYQAVKVWRRPVALGSLLTALKGVLDLRKAIRQHRIDAVMPRSVLPALTTLLALRGKPLPILFDADGLPLDERVDFAGLSPSSLIYRLLRDVEAQAVRRAAVVLTRSNKAVQILLARAGAGMTPDKFQVVGNGRDADLFKPVASTVRRQVRHKLGLNEQTPLLVYAGSVGPQYCLDEMLQLVAAVRRRRADAHLLILTGLPDTVAEALTAHPDLASAVTTLTVPPAAVPVYLASADVGLALRCPSFSMQAVAPIKLGEYLLCGLPVVATAGIGDTSDVVNEEVGFMIDALDNNFQLEAVANWLIEVVFPRKNISRDRCRNVGITRFSLDRTVENYRCAFYHIKTLS